jgi:hypothetical protein
MPKFLPILCLLGGAVLALCGALFTLGLVPRLDFSHGRFVVDLVGLLAFGLAPLALGLGGIWYGKRRLTQASRAAQVERDSALERALLQRLRAHPQGMTPQEVTTSPFSSQEVEAKLRDLYVNGVLDLEVTEQGKLIYKAKPS